MIEKLLEAVLIALVSPAIILFVSRKIETRRFEKERQLAVFKGLLRRPINSSEDLTEEFVGFLNLVYVDFSECHKVIEVRREFQKLVTRGVVGKGKEGIFDQEFQLQRALLLKEMAKELGIKVSEIDIMHGVYYPEHFSNTLETKRKIEDAKFKFFTGQQAIPLVHYDQRDIALLQVLMSVNFLSDEEKKIVGYFIKNGPTKDNLDYVEPLIEKGILDFDRDTGKFSVPHFVCEAVKNDPRFK